MTVQTNEEIGETKDFVVWSTEILSTVSAFWGLLLCGVYLWDIIGREMFNAPFQGTHELVANSIVGILFLELPSSIKRRAMIRTVFIFNVVSDKIRRTIDCSTYILGILLFAAIIWGGWETMITSWELKEFEGAGSFEVPVYPVRTLIIIFSGICCLIYLQLLYHTVTGKIAPKKG